MADALLITYTESQLGSHLKRLVVHHFRNVLPGTELTFHPGINVVLGKNGSGKTTLLRVLEAVLSGDFRLLWEEGASVTAEFAVSWGEGPASPDDIAHSGQTTLRYASSHTKSGDHKRSERLDIDILRSDGQRAALRCVDGEVILEEEGVERSRHQTSALEGRVRWSIVVEIRQAAWARLWAGAIFPFEMIWRFAEDLSDYNQLMSSSFEYSLHDSGSSVLFPSAHAWALRPPVPLFKPELLRQLTLPRIPIHDAAERMGFQTAEVTLRANDTAANPVVYGGLAIDLQRKDGSWVREEKLSWGQKRFLSWWALRPDRFIIADELTNGMHHEWITTMIEGMAGRQCFLATQNPLLLDHLEFEHADEVRARIVRCSIVEGEPREQMQWRNPTPEEAQRFFGAYENGFQHVSEILRNEDLW